ncbi:baseplate J/gp47 family protein [Sporomusa sphaeroides DSM 2875]|uniref:baseplate J/gp47 family protein n=1 Tax=Sporomusa sphaeroides TaxID=47679 RepID=UPI00202E1461|nr:baseplate J/gp47 family protein [Sporomusa sphaeroides]MCM0757339.1 baseplate J/gp47 family protein [Sporomusa sphaeroides DSM 2875]
MDWKKLIGAKTFDELVEEAKQRLIAKGSSITNWNIGGIFRTLTELAMQAVADLYTLLVQVVAMGYAKYAKGKWLDLIAEDIDVYRHLEKKTVGKVIFGRQQSGGSVRIEANSIIKTDLTIDGDELRYFVTAEIMLPEGVLEVEVPVTAEFAGARYNVGQGYIKNLVTHIDGIDYVKNAASWITEEGADEEDDEPYRERYFLKWDELSTGSTGQAYKSWARAVSGVTDAGVNDFNPRGPGTVNIYITSANGQPTQDLIDDVVAAVDDRRPQCVDVLVTSAELKTINYDIILWLPETSGSEPDTLAEAAAVIQAMHVYDKERKLEVYKLGVDVFQAKLNHYLMGIKDMKNVTINSPADTVIAENELAVRGTVALQVQRVSA